MFESGQTGQAGPSASGQRAVALAATVASSGRSPNARPTAAPPPTLWGDDGRALATLPQDRPTDSGARWSGERYATRAQLEWEQLVALPYTIVIDADDEAALQAGLELAETVHQFGGDKAQLGVFVRSRQPAWAARLAERLTAEQGWANVFVVV